MRTSFRAPAAIAAAVVAFAAVSQASGETWSFGSASRIELDGISGNVAIFPSKDGEISVRLESSVIPAGAFEGRAGQTGDTVRLSEDWDRGSSSGSVLWTIYLPGQGVEAIKISTSSGSLEARDISARLDLDTASGSIDLTNVDLEGGSELSTASGDYKLSGMSLRAGTELSSASGDFELTDVELDPEVGISTASGDVSCLRCRGQMNLSTASGDVVLRESRIEGASEFSTASGDVELYLDGMPEVDVRASSASGDVKLHSDDYGGSYSLVLRAREDKGRIVTPFDYTSTRTYWDNHPYQEKVVVRGSGGPEITLSTASGSVIVEKS